MNRDTEVTLDQVHAGIVDTIKASFPGVHVEAYREDRTEIKDQLPAILVEMTEMQVEGIDPGTGQLAVNASFDALLVIGFRQPGRNAKLEIRRLAASFAAFARLNRWGCPIGPAQVVGAYPSDFEPELDQFEVWRVEWQQVIHLGQSEWSGYEGTDQPTTVLLGQAPLVGALHVDEYAQVAP